MLYQHKDPGTGQIYASGDPRFHGSTAGAEAKLRRFREDFKDPRGKARRDQERYERAPGRVVRPAGGLLQRLKGPLRRLIRR